MAFPFRKQQVIGPDAPTFGRYDDEKAGAVGPKRRGPSTEQIIVIGRSRYGKDVNIGICNYDGLPLSGHVARPKLWV